MNIVYSSSDLYAKQAGISMLSLLEHNEHCDIHIYMLSDNISQQSRLKLEATAGKFGKQIVFIDIAEKLKTVEALANAYNKGYAPFAKFFIAELLPAGEKRALYIDCDTIINAPLDALYETDMRGKALALSSDCIRKEYRKYIGVSEDTVLYATGIVLFDLEKWNEKNCLRRLLTHMQENKRIYPLVDLDLINIVLQEDITRYELRYQVITQFFLYPYRMIFFVFDLPPDSFTETEFDEAVKNPAIYHFCGNTLGRPWYKNSRHPAKALYDSYYFSSEWKDEPQTEWKWTAAYRIQYVLYRCFPAWVSAFAGAIMQRLFVFLTYKV